MTPSVTEVKACSRCALRKPVGDFPRNSRYRAGVEGRCKSCASDAATEWKRANPRRVARANHDARRRKLGLTTEAEAHLANDQDLCCAICYVAFAGKWDIDHCHETDAVRGLLCRRCNMGLGLFLDDADSLRVAIRYLDR